MQTSGSATTAPCSRRRAACSWQSRATCWSKAGISSRPSRPSGSATRRSRSTSAISLPAARRPTAFTLALALPDADEAFLAPFARGLFAIADRHGCELVGGDTTRGPLTIAITVFGELPRGTALLRSGARPGDDLYVSGRLGDARLALEVFRGGASLDADAFERVRRAMEEPEPRVALGQALRGIASAAIDVSDGLAGDLAHLLRLSSVAASVDVDALPRSADLAAQPAARQHACLLSGGDDYELVFTAPSSRRTAVASAALAAATAVTRVGAITAGAGIRWHDGAGRPVDGPSLSFDHFAPAAAQTS